MQPETIFPHAKLPAEPRHASRPAPERSAAAYPSFGAALELLKPITWFAPMWAFGCGVVSSGAPVDGRWMTLAGGILLAGPMVCGMSQAANDWCDRHVDAVNEPNRPIPSGRIPGRWGLYIALIWTALSLALAAALGPWALGAAVVAVILAWAYSAEPIRLKREGWQGAGAVALCYEGLPWLTGAAIMAGAAPEPRIWAVALLYSLGAVGIMALNDFKAVEGDKAMGVRSLPVRLGVERAARVSCWLMALPQLAVIALLIGWDRPVHALGVALLLTAQGLLMRRMLRDPRGLAPWYNATGTSLYVLGMLVAAFALRGGAGA